MKKENTYLLNKNNIKQNKINKRYSNLLIGFLLIYMFFKVLIDDYTYGIFKIVLVGIVLGYVLLWLIEEKKYKTDYLLFLAIIIFCFYVFLQAIQEDFVFFSRAIYEYVFYILILFVATAAYKHINIIKLYRIVEYFGIIILLITFAQALSSMGQSGIRIQGISRSEMVQGTLLGIYSMFALFLYYKEKKKRHLLLFLLAFLAIIMSGSRGPLVATAVGFTVQFLVNLYIKKGRKAIYLIVGLCCVLIPIIIIFFSADFNIENKTIAYWVSRMQSIINWKHDAGNVGRLFKWEKWFKIFLDNIWLGIGPSKTGSWNVKFTLDVTESTLLRLWVELGIVGFVLFCIPIIICLASVRRKNFTVSQKKLLTLHFSILILIIIEGLMLQILEDITVAFFFWWTIGIIYSISKNSRINIK